MSCSTIPLEDGGTAVVCGRTRPAKKPGPPPSEVHRRAIVGMTLPAPWHLLVTLGLCPVVSLPEARNYLWADWVALHVPASGEDALALRLAERARVQVPEEHPLAQVRGAVVAVAQVEPLLFVSPGRGRAISPWCYGPALGRVVDVVPLHPVPVGGAAFDGWLVPWALTEGLHQEVRRAFRTARLAREHLREQETEESVHAARAAHVEQELDALLSSRLEEDGAPRTVPRLHPVDPLEALARRYRESQERLLALTLKYARYERSPTGTNPQTGLKAYLCPECHQWFSWCPGTVEHACATAVGP